MVLGPLTVTYDRGDDFLAFTRLMEDNTCFVGDAGGQLMGLACGAQHRVRIGGTEYTAMLLHHVRVPIEAKGGGVFSAINMRVFGQYDATRQAAYGYTAVGNDEGMKLGGPGSWSFGFYRCVLDCSAIAGPSAGRAASVADAAGIADIMNRCHERQEMFLPYTVESLSARLERAPDLYTWDHVLIGEGAVVGVWPANLVVTSEQDGQRRQARRGIVLDHGCLPGAEAEFEALIRTWAVRLLDTGHTEMTLLVSEASPNYHLMARLASRLDPFVFRMQIPEPEGAADRGLYVDAVYF